MPYKDPKIYQEYCRRWYQTLKLDTLDHYSSSPPKCAHCGITDIDVLCIDHIDNDGAKQRKALGIQNVAGGVFYCWLKRNDYPEGYQVLCCNCNQKKEVLRRRANRKA